MKLLPLLSLCLLTWSAATFGDQHEPVKVIVMEDRDAILPCSLESGENIESRRFEWTKDYQKDVSKEVFMYDGTAPHQSEQFRGRVSHFPDELKNGNASIKITKTKLADGGNYTCIFPNLQPQRKFNIELVVDAILKDRSRDEITGAAPKPVIRRLNETKDWALLQCEVLRAFPQPEVKWQDSDGNLVPAKDPQVSERGGSYDVILQAAVTKTDTYRCNVTQKEIHHETHKDTFVHLNESSTGPLVGAVLGALFILILVGVLLAFLVIRGVIPLKCNIGSSRAERDQTGGTELKSQESDHLKSSAE